ncbi:MAG: arginine deiminase family protein [Kiloniellales bacterium]|nr:arginine deiminase family protein [Kiloniellales bacterium]
MTWSMDSETGLLQEVLLCPPEHYDWLPLNAVAEATLSGGLRLDLQAAQAQYGEMVDALEQAGVTCHFLEPDAELKYQVYTRDSSQMTPWGPAVTQLHKPQRRGEYAAVIRFYQERGEGVWRYCTSGTLEGGDIHIIRPGLLLIGYSGGRSNEAGARQFARWFEAEGWEVRLQPFAEHFLHLDVMFCMAAEGLAVACTEVMDDGLTDWLRGNGIRLVPVHYKETMQLGCNLLALGGHRVISPRHNAKLNERLRAEGLAVFDPELDLFTKGGGGVHCMTMPLKRESLAD